MNQGAKTIVFPVKDLASAKAFYTTLLGIEPFGENSYYVGYQIGDQHFGLNVNGHADGMTGPVAYHHVDDIHAALKALTDAGAVVESDVRAVGNGRLVASVRDVDGNSIGLLQDTN